MKVVAKIVLALCLFSMTIKCQSQVNKNWTTFMYTDISRYTVYDSDTVFFHSYYERRSFLSDSVFIQESYKLNFDNDTLWLGVDTIKVVGKKWEYKYRGNYITYFSEEDSFFSNGTTVYDGSNRYKFIIRPVAIESEKVVHLEFTYGSTPFSDELKILWIFDMSLGPIRKISDGSDYRLSLVKD